MTHDQSFGVQKEETSASGLASQVNRLAAEIAGSRCSTGERASLRRWAPGQPPPLAFYRLWLRSMGEELPHREQSSAWILLAWGLALSEPSGHQKGHRLGRALAEAGYPEARLERLLAASPDLQTTLFSSLVRFMAAKGKPFDWLDAARLLLSRTAEARDRIHRDIASDYYRALRHQE